MGVFGPVFPILANSYSCLPGKHLEFHSVGGWEYFDLVLVETYSCLPGKTLGGWVGVFGSDCFPTALFVTETKETETTRQYYTAIYNEPSHPKPVNLAKSNRRTSGI